MNHHLTDDSVYDVIEKLRRLNVMIDIAAPIKGLEVDALIQTPMGELIIVDVKSWGDKIDAEMIDKASHQSELYKAVTGVAAAFVVVPQLKSGFPDRCVLNSDELFEKIRSIIDKEPRLNLMGASSSARIVNHRESAGIDLIFAAMPFAEKFDDTFLVAISSAAEALGMVGKRSDMKAFNDTIINEIHRDIRNAKAVIADLSEANPNVLYELGFAHALDKPVVHISSTPVDQLPFDARAWQIITYTLGRTSMLKNTLKEYLQELLKN